MKTKIFTILFLFSFGLNAQTTLVLNATSDNWKDTQIFDLISQNGRMGATKDINYGDRQSLHVIEWTWDGNSGSIFSLIDFDLSGIPDNSQIISAHLSLQVDSSSYFAKHSSASKSNEFVVERIVTPWDENTVTWNSQPNISSKNKSIIRDGVNNYTNANITNLVQDIYNNKTESFGIRLSCSVNDYYRGFSFASSEHPNASLRPSLTIVYEPVGAQQTVQMNNNGNSQVEIIDGSNCGNNQTLIVYDTKFKIILKETNVSSDKIAETVNNLSAGTYIFQLITNNFDVTSFKVTVD